MEKSLTEYNFFKQLIQLPNVEEVWLYGSRAKGYSLERSDIDIAIVGRRISKDDWRKIQEIIDKADTLLEIDCVHFNQLPETSTFKQQVERDKQVIFQREKGEQ